MSKLYKIFHDLLGGVVLMLDFAVHKPSSVDPVTVQLFILDHVKGD
jgi:hypothetical protein